MIQGNGKHAHQRLTSIVGPNSIHCGALWKGFNISLSNTFLTEISIEHSTVFPFHKKRNPSFSKISYFIRPTPGWDGGMHCTEYHYISVLVNLCSSSTSSPLSASIASSKSYKGLNSLPGTSCDPITFCCKVKCWHGLFWSSSSAEHYLFLWAIHRQQRECMNLLRNVCRLMEEIIFWLAYTHVCRYFLSVSYHPLDFFVDFKGTHCKVFGDCGEAYLNREG